MRKPTLAEIAAEIKRRKAAKKKAPARKPRDPEAEAQRKLDAGAKGAIWLK